MKEGTKAGAFGFNFFGAGVVMLAGLADTDTLESPATVAPEAAVPEAAEAEAPRTVIGYSCSITLCPRLYSTVTTAS